MILMKDNKMRLEISHSLDVLQSDFFNIEEDIEIHIPNSVTIINENAFTCRDDTPRFNVDIFYDGTLEEWNNLKKGLIIERNKLIDPKVDWEALAKRTVGFSGADIENILNEAAILAVRQNEPMITVKDIDEAIDRRIAGPAKSSKGMNQQERKTVAYHEAGHAIVGLKLEHSDKVQKITIIPRGRTGGHVLMTPEDDRFLLSKAELEARIIGYLGGRSSEEFFFKDVTTGASNDIEVATRIARLMVTEYGMSSLGPIQYERDTGSVFLGRDYASTQKNFSTQIAYEIDTEVRKIIDDAHKKALQIIKDNKEDVILIAETLLENETITAEEISYLLKHRSLEGFHSVPKAEEKPAEGENK